MRRALAARDARRQRAPRAVPHRPSAATLGVHDATGAASPTGSSNFGVSTSAAGDARSGAARAAFRPSARRVAEALDAVCVTVGAAGLRDGCGGGMIAGINAPLADARLAAALAAAGFGAALVAMGAAALLAFVARAPLAGAGGEAVDARTSPFFAALPGGSGAPDASPCATTPAGRSTCVLAVSAGSVASASCITALGATVVIGCAAGRTSVIAEDDARV